MSTPIQKQKRLQIILAIIIGVTIPCYALGFIFLSVNRKTAPTVTPRGSNTPTATWSHQSTDTPAPVYRTRFPTFTPTLTGTPTPTRTSTLTPTNTPEPTGTFTPTFTQTPSDTPLPTTIAPTEESGG